MSNSKSEDTPGIRKNRHYDLWHELYALLRADNPMRKIEDVIDDILKLHEKTSEPPQDTSLDDTNKALEQAFKDYRIKCDMALSERDDGVYTQAEYEEAIMWNLDNAISFVHEIYSSRIANLLQVIEDELNKFTARHDEPMKEAAIEIIKQIKERL